MMATLSEVHRQAPALGVQLYESVPLTSMVRGLVVPPALFDLKTWPMRHPEGLGFVGIAPLLLSVAGLIFSRSRPMWLVAFVGLFSIGVINGNDLFYILLNKILPYFGTFHPPEGYFLLTCTIAMLAAFGYDEVARHLRMGPSVRTLPVYAWAIAGAALVIAELLMLLRFTQELTENESLKPLMLMAAGLVATAIVALTLAVWYFQQRRQRREGPTVSLIYTVVSVPLVGLAAVQLIAFGLWINPLHPAREEWLYPRTPMVEKLEAVQGDRRILPLRQNLGAAVWTPPVMLGKVPIIFDLRSGSGYESLLPLRTANLWRAVENRGRPNLRARLAYRSNFMHDRVPIELLKRLSVAILVTPPNVEPLDPNGRNLVSEKDVTRIYEGNDGWLYEVNDALPRAFLVSGVMRISDPVGTLSALADDGFNATCTALIDSDVPTTLPAPSPDGSSCHLPDSSARIVRDEPHEIEVETVSPRAAFLVLNDSWAPGWSTFVDGVQQHCFRTNYTFRGVEVPGGKHSVIFRYHPKELVVGVTTSAITFSLFGLIAGAVWMRKLVNMDS